MSKQPQSEVLTLSSLSTGISVIVFLAVLGCFLASLPFWARPLLAWTEPDNPVLQTPLPAEAKLCGLALGLLIVALGPILLYFHRWGTWQISDEGIEFRHFLKRQSMYLRWQDVEQVHWSKMQFGLKGKGISLLAYWHWFPKPQQSQGRERLQALLFRDFDLTIVPDRVWSFDPNLRSRVTWALKMAAAVIGGTAIVPGILLLVFLCTEPNSVLRQTIATLAMVFIVVLTFLPLLLAVRSPESRRRRSINPYWRTRTESSKGTQPASF